jgi:hypothetical protein
LKEEKVIQLGLETEGTARPRSNGNKIETETAERRDAAHISLYMSYIWENGGTERSLMDASVNTTK